MPVDSLTSVPFRSRVSCCASRSNGELAKFLDNNSISDFMRYRNRNSDGDGELQTAVVRYKKRFPWSLIKPFLQVGSRKVTKMFLFLFFLFKFDYGFEFYFILFYFL